MKKTALSRRAKIERLALATDRTKGDAAIILDKLEKQGVTVYNMREVRNAPRPPSAARMTGALADKIRQMHRENPDMTQQQIAERCRVNIGRVSEVLS